MNKLGIGKLIDSTSKLKIPNWKISIRSTITTSDSNLELKHFLSKKYGKGNNKYYLENK